MLSWFAKVPLKVEDLTKDWVQRMLRKLGFEGDVKAVDAKWLKDGDPNAGGATGSKLFRIVAHLLPADPGLPTKGGTPPVTAKELGAVPVQDGQDTRWELRMVYKACESTSYGEIAFGMRMMFAIFEPGTHGWLAAIHNLGFNERDYYKSFSLERKLSDGLPTPRVYALPSRGSRVDRLRLMTTGFYSLPQANGILMEDMETAGFTGHGPHENVPVDVVHAALLQLARLHSTHWGKPYVRGKGVSLPERSVCGQQLIDNVDLCRHMQRDHGAGLVDSLLAARDAGKLVACNIPAAFKMTQLVHAKALPKYTPALFEPNDGSFYTALRKVAAGVPAILQRIRRSLARRHETLVMGDAHSGNIFWRRPSTGGGGPERRRAEDGCYYTKEEFQEFYKGFEQWIRAEPAPQPEERRRADDGQLYTKKEFKDFFNSLEEWERAQRTAVSEEPARGLGLAEPSGSDVDVRWIDFQYWGGGAVALELSYLLLGMLDDPQLDERLLQAYHAEFSKRCSSLDFGELKADVAAHMLGVAAAALFQFPGKGHGMFSCLHENPQAASEGEVWARVKGMEMNARMTYRCIRRVPAFLADASNPLVQEIEKLYAKALEAQGAPPRSRL